jgi:hypothetical protein
MNSFIASMFPQCTTEEMSIHSEIQLCSEIFDFSRGLAGMIVEFEEVGVDSARYSHKTLISRLSKNISESEPKQLSR